MQFKENLSIKTDEKGGAQSNYQIHQLVFQARFKVVAKGSLFSKYFYFCKLSTVCLYSFTNLILMQFIICICTRYQSILAGAPSRLIEYQLLIQPQKRIQYKPLPAPLIEIDNQFG